MRTLLKSCVQIVDTDNWEYHRGGFFQKRRTFKFKARFLVQGGTPRRDLQRKTQKGQSQMIHNDFKNCVLQKLQHQFLRRASIWRKESTAIRQGGHYSFPAVLLFQPFHHSPINRRHRRDTMKGTWRENDIDWHERIEAPPASAVKIIQFAYWCWLKQTVWTLTFESSYSYSVFLSSRRGWLPRAQPAPPPFKC